MNLKLNQPLYTKDGRITGNARIIKKFVGTNPKDVSSTVMFYKCETNYGNYMTLTEREINQMFYLKKDI